MHDFYTNEERVMPMPKNINLVISGEDAHPITSFPFDGLRFKNPFRNNGQQNPNYYVL